MLRMGLAAAAALGLAAPAAAQDYSPAHFETFRAVCLDTDADPDAALAVARERGWRPAPRTWAEALQAEWPGVAMLVNKRAEQDMALAPDAGFLMIGVLPEGIFADEIAGFGGDSCTLIPNRGDWDIITARMAEAIGFPANEENDDGDPAWIWSVVDGARTPVADLGDAPDEAYLALMRARPHFFVELFEVEGDPAMGMVRLRPPD